MSGNKHYRVAINLYNKNLNVQPAEQNEKAPENKVPKKRLKRGEGSEGKDVAKLLLGFDPSKSDACHALDRQFGKAITHLELLSIAQIICKKISITLNRQALRDDRVLHLWFHENWNFISPIIGKFEIFDANHKRING